MVAGLRITFADDPVHQYHAAHVLPLCDGSLTTEGGKKHHSQKYVVLFFLLSGLILH